MTVMVERNETRGKPWRRKTALSGGSEIDAKDK